VAVNGGAFVVNAGSVAIGGTSTLTADAQTVNIGGAAATSVNIGSPNANVVVNGSTATIQAKNVQTVGQSAVTVDAPTVTIGAATASGVNIGAAAVRISGATQVVDSFVVGSNAQPIKWFFHTIANCSFTTVGYTAPQGTTVEVFLTPEAGTPIIAQLTAAPTTTGFTYSCSALNSVTVATPGGGTATAVQLGAAPAGATVHLLAIAR
jgi:hypothetical protein